MSSAPFPSVPAGDHGAAVFRDRIVEVVKVPASSLRENPRNWRVHTEYQTAALTAILGRIGFAGAVLARRLPDGSLELLDGHLRKDLLGSQMVTVLVTDLDDQEALIALATHDQITSLAVPDQPMLAELLLDLKNQGENLIALGWPEHQLEQVFDVPPQPVAAPVLAGDPDDVPAVPTVPLTRPGDVWQLGRHKLMCGDATKPDDIVLLLGGAPADVLLTDPPYNVAYEGKTEDALTIANDDMDPVAYRAFLVAAFKAAGSMLKAGGAFYIWHADTFGLDVRQSCRDAGLRVRQCLIWAKSSLVLGRQDYHWRHEPCQPAGTLVAKVVKEGRWKKDSVIEQVPIETLRAGDRVVSFGNAKVYRRGRNVTAITSRRHTGNLHRVEAGDLRTRATPEHRFTVRFNPALPKAGLLYLMRRGDRWRVGVCGMFNSRGFGPTVRLDQERGDAVWVLGVYPTLNDARVVEQVVSCKYCIPTTIWETARSAGSGWAQREKAGIDAIYDMLGTDRIRAGVDRLVREYGLSLDLPLIAAGEPGNFSRTQSRQVAACNLLPHVMQVPVPTTGEGFEWRDLTAVGFERVDNLEVWSMDVERDKHYVADGIVVHNCLYGWKDGAAHVWVGDRARTTVLEYDKPAKNPDHPTPKPVEMIAELVSNSCPVGGVVLDPFAGSGTVMVACEQTGRTAAMLELDPKYCDVIVARYEQLTGSKAVLLTGEGDHLPAEDERDEDDGAGDPEDPREELDS